MGSALPAKITLILAVIAAAPGCALRVPFSPFFTPAELQESDGVEVRLDVPYRRDEGADPDKHRLDLYIPEGSGWPLLVFVHGGSLEKGDTRMRLLGYDVYRNIGRFYAARGVGVALVNYRLQPGVKWPDQVDDVATAVGWLLERKQALGAGEMFLSGHSAGSWLVSQVALDHDVQRRHGIRPQEIRRVISVSGSGYDLTDELTWELFGKEKAWRRRFSVTDPDPDWKSRASLIPRMDADAPPFLLLFAGAEWKALQRQNRLMCAAAEERHVDCELVEIPGEGHIRMMLAISDPKRDVAPRILEALGVADRADGAGDPARTAGAQSTTGKPDETASAR